MKRYSLLILIAALVALPVASQGAQFAVFGPRALGMGGASVAAVNDSTAVYWNPAALADFRKTDIRLSAGAAVRDYADLNQKWSDISDIYSAGINSASPAQLQQLQQMLLELDRPDAVSNVDATGGLLLSIPFSRSAIAISALGVGYAEVLPTIDTYHLNTTNLLASDSIALNDSAVTGIGLVTVEPAISFATSLFDDRLFVGANVKMIYASTFVSSALLRTGDFSTFIDNLNNSETKNNKGSIDAGILVRPVKSLNLGIVGRYLNSPSFPATGPVAGKQPSGSVVLVPLTGDIELKPQYRAGVAWKPFDILTLTADYDLTKNKSFTERTEDQTIAGGAELTLFSEVLSLRAGAYKNTANDLANVVYTAGLGLRIAAFRLDLAGAYDFKEQEAQASVNLALKF